jgi:excisionase family DNA binding protein
MHDTGRQLVGDHRMDGRVTLTVEEAGQLLGIGRGLAYESARRGDIPTLRIGRRLVVPKAALDRLLANGQTPDPIEGAA